jgi:signal transduction histidine kinase
MHTTTPNVSPLAHSSLLRSPTPSFKSCQFILDARGVILAHDENAHDKIGYQKAKLEGLRFSEILFEINPHWSEFLTEEIPPRLLFLPWQETDQQHPYGIELKSITLGGQTYITLSPALAPQEFLKNASVLDVPRNKDSFAQLFLRLQTAESRLNTYMHHFPGIFFSQRPDLSFTYIGPRLNELLSIDSNKLARSGGEYLKLILEKDRELFLSKIERHSLSPKTFSLNYRLKHPVENTILYVMDVRTPIFSPTGLLLGYEGVWLDITRQSIAENQLTRNAWKESLAMITKGLIHDFSNIMAGIYSISELYEDALDKDHPWIEGIGQIKKSSREAQQIVRRIIDLNRDITGKRGYHNLNTLLKEHIELIELVLPKQINVKQETNGEEIPVYLDDVRFRQMLLNLVINARDALSQQGGTITISTEKISQGTPYADNEVAPTPGVLLRVKDNGSGIEEKHLSRIFAPLFTTKEAGKGSGFGLYNAKLFVQENEGRISVTSTLGKETCFHIFLPIANFCEELSLEESPIKLTNRPQALVYAAKDPEQLEIISDLRRLSCEITSFKEQTALIHYLSTQSGVPKTLVFVDLDDDASLHELILIASKLHSKANIVLLTHTHRLDSIPEMVLNKIHLTLHDSLSPQEQLSKLECLLVQ